MPQWQPDGGHVNWVDDNFIASGRFPLKNDCHFFVEAEALYWQATENGLEYVVSASQSSNPPERFSKDEMKVEKPHFKWDWGFRVGAGYNIPHDKWDIFLNWTHFNTKANAEQVAASPDFEEFFFQSPVYFNVAYLFPIWIHSNTIPGQYVAVNLAKVCWKLNLNLFDLELGKKFFVGKWVTLRPFLGVRGAVINQKYDVNYFGSATNPITGFNSWSDVIRMKNDFYGVGGRLGLDGQWGLFKEVSLYGNFAFSLLYGHFSVERDEVNRTSFEGNEGVAFFNYQNPSNICRAIADLSVGLSWDHLFCQDRVHLGIYVGWDQHFLFGQNQLMKIDDGINFPSATEFTNANFVNRQDVKAANDDLTLSGLKFGMRLDF